MCESARETNVKKKRDDRGNERIKQLKTGDEARKKTSQLGKDDKKLLIRVIYPGRA